MSSSESEVIESQEHTVNEASDNDTDSNEDGEEQQEASDLDGSDTGSNEDDEEQKEASDLDASDTDSDEDSADMDDEDSKPKSTQQKVAEVVNQKFAERQGKQLYIRFPHKLPEENDEFQKLVKALSPLIVKAHKPRQKYARFCLIDFKSTDDRVKALKAIKAAAKDQEDGAKIVAQLPRTEKADFVQELVRRKVNSLENKKAKKRLRRARKLALRDKNFTSSIVVKNLPSTATKAEVRRLFPTAIDIQMKHGKGILNRPSMAAITLPSTMEARNAVRKKHSLGGTDLVVRFDIQKLQKSKSLAGNKNGSKKLQPVAKKPKTHKPPKAAAKELNANKVKLKQNK